MESKRAWMLASVLLCSCGTTIRYAETNAPPRAMVPRPASAVAVSTSGVPTRPYVEVGILSARQSSQYSTSDMQNVIDAMRKRAGQIGCDALVVTGSDNVTHGSYSGSQGTGSGNVYTLEGVKAACIVWTGVEAQAPAQAEAKAQGPKPASEPANPDSPSLPTAKPQDAGGFVFGQAIESARLACVEAKHGWAQVKGARYSCNGAPTSVGMPATLALRFCKGRLCEINVDARATDTRDAFRTTRDTLSTKYGEPKKTTEEVPEECSPEQLPSCIADSRAALIAEWWWDSGERITEKVARSDADGGAILRLTYTKWPLDPPETPSSDGL